jgi:hypothetical protein
MAVIRAPAVLRFANVANGVNRVDMAMSALTCAGADSGGDAKVFQIDANRSRARFANVSEQNKKCRDFRRATFRQRDKIPKRSALPNLEK